MYQKFAHKQPELVKRIRPILGNYNARPHVSLITRRKLHINCNETLDHPPYSPNLSPTDYDFIKHLDNFLLQKCFRFPKDIETTFNTMVASRTAEFYDSGIKKHVSRLQKHVEVNDFYFD
ncbi:histone-lysine N-methyltransferase SETMAR [Trichonephila clavipes]|nr:histone-lysine N-methyltransferase SETMAR [Trichonephila clavipes]